MFSPQRLIPMGVAGLGAVVASSIQASSDFGMGQNVRDVVLTGVAVVGAGMGGSNMRAFALGFGAAAVGSLIRRNVLTTV